MPLSVRQATLNSEICAVSIELSKHGDGETRNTTQPGTVQGLVLPLYPMHGHVATRYILILEKCPLLQHPTLAVQHCLGYSDATVSKRDLTLPSASSGCDRNSYKRVAQNPWIT